MRRAATIQRLEKRVDELCDSIGFYLDYFEQSDPFTGPSVYFHSKTLQRRHSHKWPSSLLADDLFFDYLYATLAAWGMHRMGPGGAKLVDLRSLMESVLKQKNGIEALWELRLIDLPESELISTVDYIWNILDRLQVSATETKLVANTKALHHLLPDLVPPMDRAHTLAFFFNNASIEEDKRLFVEIYPYFWQIAHRLGSQISERVNKHAFHTSVSKVIDNAIMGFVRKEVKVRGGKA